MKLFEIEVNKVYRTTNLLSDEFSSMIAQATKPYSIWYDFTNTFDKWDIERFFEKIKEYAPKEMLIMPSHESINKPFYKEIIEMRDALNALATDLGTVGSGFHKYEYHGTHIYFTQN